jgi:hypothetical protein
MRVGESGHSWGYGKGNEEMEETVPGPKCLTENAKGKRKRCQSGHELIGPDTILRHFITLSFGVVKTFKHILNNVFQSLNFVVRESGKLPFASPFG